MSATGGGARPVPRIGLGTAVQGPKPDPVRRAVFRAIELGYRLFDTAAHYATEAPIGEAVAEAVRAGVVASRDEVFITSKVWCADAHRDRVLPALRRTLRCATNSSLYLCCKSFCPPRPKQARTMIEFEEV